MGFYQRYYFPLDSSHLGYAELAFVFTKGAVSVV
jgi:hypothetical protein